MYVLWIKENPAAAKSLQSCPTLCDPIDGSPPDSTIPGILQARTLEWVAISFSNAGKWKGKGKSLSRVRLFVTPWTAAHEAPPSMGFSRQEYWNGVPIAFSKWTLEPGKGKVALLSREVRTGLQIELWAETWRQWGTGPAGFWGKNALGGSTS